MSQKDSQTVLGRTIAQLGAVAILVALGVLVHVVTLDGILGVIGGLLLPEDTTYAEGYSDSAFRSVSVGMSREEVRNLLGKPLRTTEAPYYTEGKTGVRCWLYSMSPRDTNYRIRCVCFDTSGAVVRKHAEFWFD